MLAGSQRWWKLATASTVAYCATLGLVATLLPPQPRQTLFYSYNVFFTGFAPDGSIVINERFEDSCRIDLVTCDDGHVRQSLTVAHPYVICSGNTGFWGMVWFTPDCRTLAFADDRGTIYVHAIEGREIARVPYRQTQERTATGQLHGMQISPDGRYLAIQTNINPPQQPLLELVAWDLTERRELWYANYYEPPALFAPDGRTLFIADVCDNDLAFGQTNVVKVLDVATGEVIRRFDNHPGTCIDLRHSSDGLLLFGTCNLVARPGQDYVTVVWDAATGKELTRLKDEAYPCCLPDSDLICTWHLETTGCIAETRVFDPRTGVEVISRRLPVKSMAKDEFNPFCDCMQSSAQGIRMIDLKRPPAFPQLRQFVYNWARVQGWGSNRLVINDVAGGCQLGEVEGTVGWLAPDGKTLAALRPGQETTIDLYELPLRRSWAKLVVWPFVPAVLVAAMGWTLSWLRRRLHRRERDSGVAAFASTRVIGS